MNFMQLKRWMSFLPAGFIVYFLLHYLVYQPDLSSQNIVTSLGFSTSSRQIGSNSSSEEVLSVRSIQSGHIVLPMTQQTTDDPTPAVQRGIYYTPVGISSSTPSDPSSPDDLDLLQGGDLTESDVSVGVGQAIPIVFSSRDVRMSVSLHSPAMMEMSGLAGGTGVSDNLSSDKPQTSSSIKKGLSITSSVGTLSKSVIASVSTSEQKQLPSVQGDKQPSVPPAKRTSVSKRTIVGKASNSSPLAINYLRGKHLIGDTYESGFSVPHEDLCPNNGRDLKVLVLITTAPDHFSHRTAIRQTWGHFSMRKDIVMGFVIGRTMKPEVQEALDRENEVFGDVIQGNIIDHYGNLTLKSVAIFEWIKTYCSEVHFILKTDDDMYINVPLLLAFVDLKRSDKRVLYGRLAKGWKPIRNKKSKYYVGVDTYSKSRYPDFLTGPAYLFTNDVVEDVYQKALSTTFFFLEDVLITGIVSESLRLRRVGDVRFRNDKIKLTDICKLMSTISVHMVKYEEQFDIYKKTLDGKIKCKKV